MSDETWQMKSALRHLTYGVYVVSARRNSNHEGEQADELNALTVRMVSQVCAQPPCVSVSILKRRYTHDFICQSRAFAINILAQGQEMLGGHFGLRTGRDSNKMLGLEWKTGITGSPILPDCSAFLECRVIAAHDLGNTTVFIGQVVNQGSFARAPLCYREEDYFG